MTAGYGEILGTAVNAAGSLGQGISDIAVAYSNKDQTKANRARISELEYLDALGALGLTEEEKQLAHTLGTEGSRQTIQDIQADAARRAAASSTGDVQALADQDAALSALGVVQSQVGGQISTANLVAAERQRQELEDRRAVDAETRANRARAVGNLLTGGILTGGGQAVQQNLKAGNFRSEYDVPTQPQYTNTVPKGFKIPPTNYEPPASTERQAASPASMEEQTTLTPEQLEDLYRLYPEGFATPILSGY